MSTLNAQALYALLPSVYRLRDLEQGEPLKALVGLLAQVFEQLEEDVEQLYDDQFIETCADWVVPYIGDLIGYRPLEGGRVSARAEVAHTLALRRRKGTLAALEQIGRDVSGWPAHAAELFERLAHAQHMNHARPQSQTLNLRHGPALLRLGGAFDGASRCADVRSVAAGAARPHPANIALYLWRLQPLAWSGLPLTPDPLDASGRRFFVSPLAADLSLWRRPQAEDSVAQRSGPAHVPERLRVRELAYAWQRAADARSEGPDYGVGASVLIQRQGVALPLDPVVHSADLRDYAGGWAHEASVPPEAIYLDPERGRVLLGATRAAEQVVAPFEVSLHRALPRPFGGGEYAREPLAAAGVQRQAQGGGGLQTDADAIAPGGRLMLSDSRRYTLSTLRAQAGARVLVTAARGAWPLLDLGAELALDLGADSRLELEGLLITGAGLHLPAAPDNAARTLVLRHCTLLPGGRLARSGAPAQAGAVSLRIEHPFARIELQDCIVGGLRLHGAVDLRALGSALDAGAPDATLLEAPGGGAGGKLWLQDCTLVGRLHAQEIERASDCLFHAEPLLGLDPWPAPLWVQERQRGCVRHSGLPAQALLPPRYRCLHVRPQFMSLWPLRADYLQLRASNPAAMLRVASDGAEPGVYHPLAQTLREAHVRTRFDEYLRLGLQAGLIRST